MLRKIYVGLCLAVVGVSWFYETFSITTKRTPTITAVIHANRHRPVVPPTVAGGCLVLAAGAIKHLLIVKEIIEAEVSSASCRL